MHTQEIHELLLKPGIGRQYRGYSIITQAILLILEDEKRLLSLKQEIYQPVAEQQHCDWRAVERNIRTAIRRAWELNPELLQELSPYPMKYEPCAAEFLDILSAHIEQKLP